MFLLRTTASMLHFPWAELGNFHCFLVICVCVPGGSVCIYACMHTSVCACMCVCSWVHVSACEYMCMCTVCVTYCSKKISWWKSENIKNQWLHFVDANMHQKWSEFHTCTYASMHVSVCRCLHMCACMCRVCACRVLTRVWGRGKYIETAYSTTCPNGKTL